MIEIRGCDPATVGIDDAKDIYAIIEYLSTLSTIDSRNIVVAGQSFGGWNSVVAFYYLTNEPPKS